eukprot:ANDGO_08537.mRNA.1 CDK5RAP3-like protein
MSNPQGIGQQQTQTQTQTQTPTPVEDRSPLDIPYTRLLDWMLDRQVVSRKWFGSYELVRSHLVSLCKSLVSSHPHIAEKIAHIHFVKAAQEDDGRSPDTFLGYTTVLEVLSVVDQDAELGKKGFLGGYSSKVAADWDALRKSYESAADKVFLGEAARQIVQLVSFDIPALKKQIAKRELQIAELEKSSLESKRKETELRHSYVEKCKRMGIQGLDVETEIKLLAKGLPALFKQFLEACSDPRMESAALYFRLYTRHFFESEAADLGECAQLAKLAQEYRDEKSRVGIAHSDGSSSTHEETERGVNPEEMVYELTPEDFGIELEMSGLTLEASGDAGSSAAEQLCEGNGQPAIATSTATKVYQSLVDVLIEDADRRYDSISDLLELKEFLAIRIQEIAEEAKLDADTQRIVFEMMKDAPQHVCETPVEQLKDWLKLVENTIALVDSDSMKQLLTIRKSDSYVKRLAAEITSILRSAERQQWRQKEISQKQHEYREDIQKTYPKIADCVGRAKKLQKLMQTDLSTRFKGRPVHITGEINIL